MSAGEQERVKALKEKYGLVAFTPELKPKRRRWIVEDTFLTERINFVAGAGKAGKSRLFQWLLTALLTGQDNRLGLNAGDPADVPKRWLYITAEEMAGEVAARMRGYAKELGAEKAEALSLPIEFCEAHEMQLERYDKRAELAALLKGEGFDAVIIDPMRRVHGANENDSTEMAALTAAWRSWAKQGITPFIVHHTGGTGLGWTPDRINKWLRGSSDLEAALDACAFVWRPKVTERKVMLYRAGKFPPPAEGALVLHDGGDPHEPKRAGKGWMLAEDREDGR